MPAVVGVPEIVLVVALNVKPGGISPTRLTALSGAVPPLAVSVVVYAVPTLPAGRLPEIVGSGLTVILTDCDVAVPAMVAERVTFICEVIPDGAV